MEKAPLPENLRRRFLECVALMSQRPEEMAKKFVARCLALPEKVSVSLEPFRAPYVSLEPGIHEVWLVVRGDSQSVFYDPINKNFGACWGPVMETGELIDLGFRSDDPYEMYVI